MTRTPLRTAYALAALFAVTAAGPANRVRPGRYGEAAQAGAHERGPNDRA
jgi:hypothetical protein